jgi:hypothetical protein
MYESGNVCLLVLGEGGRYSQADELWFLQLQLNINTQAKTVTNYASHRINKYIKAQYTFKINKSSL